MQATDGAYQFPFLEGGARAQADLHDLRPLLLVAVRAAALQGAHQPVEDTVMLGRDFMPLSGPVVPAHGSGGLATPVGAARDAIAAAAVVEQTVEVTVGALGFR